MNFTKNITIIIFILIGLVTILGIRLDLMIPDATLYANISKTIYLNNDFINLYSLGDDWLDKPHLPFWLTAISFKIFGVNNFAYKIPGVLMFFFGCWITYKFAKENYNKETAILATIILFTSLHSVISNFDVRAEPYLTAFVIASVYWSYKYITTKKIISLIIACFFAALAVMTKGVFALIPLVAAIGGELLIKKQWKTILNPIWIVAILLILLLITPEIYTLYQQFDMHPEKIVFGKTNVSGIKFFFWDSQFGRFFNNGPIVKKSGDISFFLHTILWAFLPWSILFYIASFLKIKRNIKSVNKNEEFYSLFAMLATILIFSLSKFQLAHYTNIVFPFMAIITADFIYKLKTQYQKLQKTYAISQYMVITIALVIIPLLFILMQPKFNLAFLGIVGLSIWLLYQAYHKKDKIHRIFYYSVTAFCVLYGFMFTHFYPTLLKYQGDVYAAKFANNNYKENIHFIEETKSHFFGYEFYSNTLISRVSLKKINLYSKKVFFVNEHEKNLLTEKSINFTVEKSFNYYPITRLKGSFINEKTRNTTLEKRYFIRLQ